MGDNIKETLRYETMESLPEYTSNVIEFFKGDDGQRCVRQSSNLEIKVDSIEPIDTVIKETSRVETIESLPGYKFNVVEFFNLDTQFFKADDGKWYVQQSSNLEIKDGVITCSENTFKKLCEDISEFDKFKSWLNEQNPINIVYKKEL